MAAPEHVISTGAFETYPGGVIVLKCAEWLGAARGTLTTEADSRSACGTVVRDSQTVTASIFDTENLSQTTALAEADDTLVIDTALLPLEIDFRYTVMISMLIEGDWNAADEDTTRGAHQERFNAACQMRWYMGSLGLLAATRSPDLKNRLIDSYRIIGMGITGQVTGTQVMTWRAYSQSGTTCEFLLDQIYLVPSPTTNTGDWDTGDFELVPGNWSTSGIGGIDDGFVDGADGGDDNGKFTWHPNVFDEQTFATTPGGGDYQKDPLDEYMIRVQPDDLFIWNSVTSAEAPCHAYGCHGPFYIPAQNWMTDDFTRTVGDNNFAGAPAHFVTQTWGDSPEGFAWRSDGGAGPSAGTGRTAWVNGTEGGMENRGHTGQSISCFLRSFGGETGTNIGADIRADNFDMAGFFRMTANGSGASAATLAISTENPSTTGPGQQPIRISFNLLTGVWSLFANDGTAAIAGPFTEAWWGVGEVAGWRIEIRRYRIFVRVWDASGAEPSTWDVEMFRPMLQVGTLEAYDYGDDLNLSILESDVSTVFLRYTATSTTVNYNTLFFDDITVDYDPQGTNESSFASIEQPEGTQISSIELPAGCQHLVYWGTRDWTSLDAGLPYLDFSGKMWNDSGAAELQRGEAVWWWFRSVHAALIPMNWRSSDRSAHGQNRILAGG